MNNNKTDHILSIDILRGIFALSIVFYHYIYYSHIKLPNVLAVTGEMGVDGFFVISGFALFHVYKNINFIELNNTLRYFIRRFLRIAPLLYFVLVDSIQHNEFYLLFCIIIIIGLLRYLHIQQVLIGILQFGIVLGFLIYGYFNTAINIWPTMSLMYGFYNSAISLPGGSWSLGIEFVFYTLLPLFVVYINNDKKNTAVILLFATASYFGYQYFNDTHVYRLHDPTLLKIHWIQYVGVLNHFYFFIAGILFYQTIFKYKPKNETLYIGILFSISCYYILSQYFYPDEGVGRVLFSINVMLMVAITSSLRLKPTLLIKPLMVLGDISYTIYLMQFPVWYLDIKWLHVEGVLGNMFIKFVILIIASILVFYFYEKSVSSLKHATTFRNSTDTRTQIKA